MLHDVRTDDSNHTALLCSTTPCYAVKTTPKQTAVCRARQNIEVTIAAVFCMHHVLPRHASVDTRCSPSIVMHQVPRSTCKYRASGKMQTIR